MSLPPDYDFRFVCCPIYRSHVQERIAEKVAGWQVFSCCSQSSHIRLLYSFVWFRGLVFTCTCVDGSEGVTFYGNLHLSTRGWGKVSSEQVPEVVLVDVLNAVNLF